MRPADELRTTIKRDGFSGGMGQVFDHFNTLVDGGFGALVLVFQDHC